MEDLVLGPLSGESVFLWPLEGEEVFKTQTVNMKVIVNSAVINSDETQAQRQLPLPPHGCSHSGATSW